MKDELLDRDEWDFSRIPDDELESAWFYELARTVWSCLSHQSTFPEYVSQGYDKALEWGNDADMKFWFEHTVGWYDEWTDSLEIPGFRDRPWIKLPARAKHEFNIAYTQLVPEKMEDGLVPCSFYRPLVHLEYNPRPDSEVLRKRIKFIQEQEKHKSSLQLFELRIEPGQVTKKQLIHEFEKFLNKEFPDLPTGNGRPKSKWPNLIDLTLYRLSRKYPEEETANLIRGVYSSRPQATKKAIRKSKENIHRHVIEFCSPLKPTLAEFSG